MLEVNKKGGEERRGKREWKNYSKSIKLSHLQCTYVTHMDIALMELRPQAKSSNKIIILLWEPNRHVLRKIMKFYDGQGEIQK